MYEIAFGFLPRMYKRGSVIYGEDEEVEELYLIRKGIVTAGFTLKREKYVAKEFVQTEYIGAYYIFENLCSEFHYEAKTDVEVIGIPKNYFQEVLKRHSKKREEIKKLCTENYLNNVRPEVMNMRERIVKKKNFLCPYEDILYDKKVQKFAGKKIVNVIRKPKTVKKIINKKLTDVENNLKEITQKMVKNLQETKELYNKLKIVLNSNK